MAKTAGVAVGMQQPRAEQWAEWLASRRAGQLVFRGVDSLMRVVEKSLLWSLQSPKARIICPHSVNELALNGETPVVKTDSSPCLVIVDRPLSWPLFLPLLSVLSVVRVTVYYASRLVRSPCDTTDIIHWLQNKRRKLRVIKYAGIRNISQQVEGRLGRTPNGTPCKPLPPGSSTPEQERKRKYDDVEQSDWTEGSEDESIVAKLDKYEKNYDSDADSDFVPSDNEEDSCESIDSSDTLDESECLDDGAVMVPTPDVSITAPVSSMSPEPSIPSIVTVEPPEPVSDYGSSAVITPTHLGSGVVAPASLSPRSKFVKFFRRNSKTKQQP